MTTPLARVEKRTEPSVVTLNNIIGCRQNRARAGATPLTVNPVTA